MNQFLQRIELLRSFWILQLLFWLVAVGYVTVRSEEQRREYALPQLREIPLHIEPLYDNPLVVTDEQLELVLYRLQPRLRGPEPKINDVEHALRFLGSHAEFADPECLSGEELRQLLVDYKQFAAVWGTETEPLITATPSGGAIARVGGGPSGSTHWDHTLAALAETYTPLSMPLTTPTAELTVRDLLEQSMRDFSLNQTEYEWSVLSFALYAPSAEPWYTKENQLVDFNLMAQRIMREPLPLGVCAGNHRLHTLTVLLRIDSEYESILTPQIREEIMGFLTDCTRRLIQNQHESGYWTINWSHSQADRPVEEAGDILGQRILATGHALEWWALAPESLHPPRPVLVKGGQWLARTILELSDRQIAAFYPFLTHAGSALTLWRSQDPSAFLAQRLEK